MHCNDSNKDHMEYARSQGLKIPFRFWVTTIDFVGPDAPRITQHPVLAEERHEFITVNTWQSPEVLVDIRPGTGAEWPLEPPKE